MSRIPGAFRRLGKAGEAALIPYFTAALPSLDATRRLLPVIGRQGADLIAIGTTPGDTFDGSPSATLDDCLSIAAEARRSNEVPLVLLAHHDVAQAYGFEHLATACAAAGVDALLVPDLAIDPAHPLAEECRAAGVDLVLNVTPTTSGAHLAELGTVAGGFVYCAADDAAGLATLIEHVRLHTDLPVVVPSVASTPEEVAALSRLADGVLVAVELVSVTESDAEDDLMLDVSEVVRSLKEVTHKSDPVR